MGWRWGASGAVRACVVSEKVAFVWMGFHFCLLASVWLVDINLLPRRSSAGAWEFQFGVGAHAVEASAMNCFSDPAYTLKKKYKEEK